MKKKKKYAMLIGYGVLILVLVEVGFEELQNKVEELGMTIVLILVLVEVGFEVWAIMRNGRYAI